MLQFNEPKTVKMLKFVKLTGSETNSTIWEEK